MTKISQKPNIFRLAPKTSNVGAYSLSNATDEDARIKEEEKLKEKYNEKLLQQALQLKANVKEYAKANNLTFDDKNQLNAEYYIKLAQRMNIQGIMEASLAVAQSKLNGYPDVDSKWAGFSYEEIIQMENNGCDIPEEVLLWAHAQQQADITSYVIVSESSSSEDELSKQDNDINSLEKKVKQYVTKSEDAIEASKKAFEKYTQEAEKATQIKKEKENTYKSQMEEISDLTKEWKTLNEKSKTNSLTNSEQERFSELGKQINGSDGTKMKEVKNTRNDLDNFLNSIDTLNNQTTENNQISQDTVNATIELSKLTRNFTNFILPHDTKEMFINNGLLANTLQNIRGDEITKTAMDTVKNLDGVTADIDKTLKDNTNVELKEFSDDYTALAKQTENDTENTMGDDYNKSQNENENEEQKVVEKDKYSVEKIFSFANSIVATSTTLKSLSDMDTQKQTTKTTEKSLKSAMKASEKDIKSLDKETKSLKQKQEQSTQEEETFLEKLDTLNEKQSKPAEKPEDAQNENGEKTGIIAGLEAITSDKNKFSEDIKKAAAKSITSDKKSSKLAELLRANTKELVSVNNDTRKVAADTQYVGGGTAAKSIITRSVGTILCQIGTTMAQSIYPPTVLTGLKMITAGIAVLHVADLELGTGLTAFATGTAALAASSDTKDTEQEAKNTQKIAKALTKENKANIKDSIAQVNNKEQDSTKNANVTATSETDQTQTENSSPSPEEQGQVQAENNTNNKNNETLTENENNQQNDKTLTASQPQKEEGGNSLEEKFGFTYSVAAAATTIAATAELTNGQATINNKENQFKINLAKIKKLEKQNQNAEKVAQAIQKKVIQQSTQAVQQIENANIEMEQGAQSGNAEQITSAQIEIQNLSETLDESIKEGATASLTLNKNLQTTTNNITQNENEAKDIKTETTQLNTKIDTQRDISETTIGIGVGTTAIGGAKVIAGLTSVSIGAGLLPDPFTHAMGQTMIVAGNIEINSGEKDIVGGGIATATGAAGLIANAAAKLTTSTTNTDTNEGNAQLKTAKQLIQKIQKDNQAQEKEAQGLTEEVNNISASASTNADVNDSTSDSDKEDRKLARFNSESIIESKKKRKKVLAVSASSRG